MTMAELIDGAVEDRLEALRFDNTGETGEVPLLLSWQPTNPVVLLVRELLGPASVRWWEVPLHVLSEALEDSPIREMTPKSQLHVWRNEDHLSMLVTFSDDRRLYQMPVYPVISVVELSLHVMEQLGGPNLVEGAWKQGGLAALEMLANGGLGD